MSRPDNEGAGGLKATVLGISAFYHDAAAALVRDGEIIAAAQEERFSRVRHDPRFPVNAINYCLEEAFIEPKNLDAVVFYDNPIATFDRILQNFLDVAPAGEAEWQRAALSVLGAKRHVRSQIEQILGSAVPVLYADHHLAHAASAYFPSPFDDAAILTVDGVGEWATTSLAHGRAGTIELLEEIRYPHSLGLLYSAFTYFCGFKVNSGEYKLMGLAPYGEPRYADRIRDHLVDVQPDGSFRLNLDYFGFLDSPRMTSDAFATLFDGPPRRSESRITQREMDLAASVQTVLEEIMLRLSRHVQETTGSRQLVMAGGVALNCVANGKIARAGLFDDIWIQPAAGDAGGALGAALLASHVRFDVPRQATPDRPDAQKGSYLGPAYSSAEVRAFLDRSEARYEVFSSPAERAERVARELAAGKVVGYMTGRMEFGPRALGARSILADPRSPEIQSALNLKVKHRESFRPFAPAVLESKAAEWFDMESPSPYMLHAVPLRETRRKPVDPLPTQDKPNDMIAQINQVRSDIPAVTHVDYSARVQTVGPTEKPDFFELLEAFEAETGCPVLVNTSFNLRGEPIVCSPEDAYRCFMRTEIDILVIEDCLLNKAEQPAWTESEDWRDAFELD